MHIWLKRVQTLERGQILELLLLMIKQPADVTLSLTLGSVENS